MCVRVYVKDDAGTRTVSRVLCRWDSGGMYALLPRCRDTDVVISAVVPAAVRGSLIDALHDPKGGRISSRALSAAIQAENDKHVYAAMRKDKVTAAYEIPMWKRADRLYVPGEDTVTSAQFACALFHMVTSTDKKEAEVVKLPAAWQWTKRGIVLYDIPVDLSNVQPPLNADATWAWLAGRLDREYGLCVTEAVLNGEEQWTTGPYVIHWSQLRRTESDTVADV